VLLAEAAGAAALAEPGVAGLAAQPAACVVPGGGYEVTLRLVVAPVALAPLGARVRESVFAAARARGLDDRLAAVALEFADVAEPAGA
jgi:hypothetical protein